MIETRPSSLLSDKERPRRIVLTTAGSLGDLHPYLAIGLGLQARGHEAIIGTGECYRQKIEALGLGFRPVRPDCDWVSDGATMRRYMNLRLGLIRVTRELILAKLRETYDDTLAAVQGADLLVSQVPLAPRLVAEKTGLPWVSTIYMPIFFFSVHDMAVLPIAPVLTTMLHRLGPWFWQPVVRLAKYATRPMAKPWYRLRSELGLPPVNDLNPIEDSHSPTLVLALFSRLLGDKQPDWPPQALLTGFPLFKHAGVGMPPALDDFLDHGPPPLIFTLGTAVSADAGSFFEHSVVAARMLGRRAILMVNHPHNRPLALPEGIVSFDYAPFEQLFPRAAALIHHGGVGSTGLAMRAGRPMLVVPHAWDQPDNAARVVRLGIARSISRYRYTPKRVATELRRLLDEPSYARRASHVGEQVRQEDGVRVACDALEKVLASQEHK